MRELFGAELQSDDHPMSREELAQALKTAHVLVPTVTDRLDRELIAEAGPDLKLIANFGNGVDHIDVAARHRRASPSPTRRACSPRTRPT